MLLLWTVDFFQINFCKKIFQKHYLQTNLHYFNSSHAQSFSTRFIRVLNSLDPDQDRCNVGPDLGPKLFAKVSSRRQKSPLARR